MPIVRSPSSDVVSQQSDEINNCESRCKKCKVVINELLAFISNKIDTLPETGISQICLSAYSCTEIENARTIAFKLLAPTKKIMRRKEGSEQKNVQEIIKLIKEFEPDCLPVFVAKDLNKLPAVSFDHIDVTTFLKEMALLKKDVACIKAKPCADSQEETLSSVRSEIENVKKMLLELREARNECSTSVHNDLFLGSYRDDKNTRNKENENLTNSIAGYSEPKNSKRMDISNVTERRVRGERGGARPRPTPRPRPLPQAPAPIQPVPSTLRSVDKTLSQQQLSADNDTPYVASYRDILDTVPTVPRREKDDDGFVTVTRKRHAYRYRNERGTLQNASKLQAAESFAYIYLSRTKKNIMEDDIKDYINGMKEECFGVELLNQTRETNFNSFKITVSVSKLNVFLQKDFWPENLVFRKYRQLRSVRNGNVSSQNQ